VTIANAGLGDSSLPSEPKTVAGGLDVEGKLLESVQRGHRALESGGLGAWNIDPSTNELASDERFRMIFQGSAAPMTYEQAFAAVHPDDRQRIRDAVAAATRLEDPAPYAEEYRVLHPDGSMHWVFARGRANFTETLEGPKVASFDGTVMDITERKRAETLLRELEARQGFLLRLADNLRPLGDAHAVQAEASRLLGEHLGANRVAYFEIRGTDYVVERDFAQGVPSLAGRYPTESFGLALLARLKAGGTMVEYDTMADPARTAGELAAFAGIQVYAYIVVPLVKGGNFVAGFAALSATPRQWTFGEVALVEETAGRTWAAVERARAEEALRESEGRFRFLDVLGNVTRGASEPVAVMKAAARLLGEHLRVTRCAYADVEPDNDCFTIRDDWAVEGVPSTVGTYSLNLFGPRARDDMHSGRILIVRDVDAELIGDDGGAAMFNAIGIKAVICCPLVKDGQLKAMMAVHSATPRSWTDDDVTLVREASERSWAHIERVRYAAALRSSEERYRMLFDSMDEGFCVIDVIFDREGKATDYRFLETNPAFQKQSGLANAVGRTIREILPHNDAHWFETYGRVATTGEPIRFERLGKSLGDRWFDVYAFRLGGTGSTKVAVLFNDVTDRKQAEQDRERLVGELQKQDRRKDEFLAMLSHELRNPLAPIANAVQLLRLHGSEDTLQTEARTIIERQVTQLKRLIDDLLDVSRITTGRVQLRLERITLSGIVERALETVRPLITRRRHDLSVAVGRQPIWLHADAARLEQVLVNLLTNAAKYTEEGGRIWLTAQLEDAEAVLRVRDTGVGIAPDLLPHVFDLFTQAERSLDRSDGGLGIGLALVQRLVEFHGGRVEATSVPGTGSEFVVRLPMVAPSDTTDFPAPDKTLPPGKSCRVLVVDDHHDSAYSLARLLRLAKHDVRTAHDGGAALEIALAFLPDVVLLDIGLPHMDGYEVARQIRQQPTLRGMMLVALTGYGRDSDREMSRAAGFDRHLVKPADFNRILEILAGVEDNGV
jgi:PAS domain S-box-containing protein